jgi:hypothetical protein
MFSGYPLARSLPPGQSALCPSCILWLNRPLHAQAPQIISPSTRQFHGTCRGDISKKGRVLFLNIMFGVSEFLVLDKAYLHLSGNLRTESTYPSIRRCQTYHAKSGDGTICTAHPRLTTFLEHIAPWHRLRNPHLKHVYQGSRLRYCNQDSFGTNEIPAHTTTQDRVWRRSRVCSYRQRLSACRSVGARR